MITLKDLYPIGLLEGSSVDTQKRFEKWVNLNTPVYENRETAKAARPAAFKNVETRWGHAGYIYRKYPLKDGRVVIKEGITWDIPEPGGWIAVYYFA